MMLGCLRLGAMPELDFEVNLAPVDYVAGSLVALSLRRENLGGTFHLVNPDPLRFETLVDWVRESQLPMAQIPAEHWRKQVWAHIEALPSDVFGLLTRSFMPGIMAGHTENGVPAVLQLRYGCRDTLRCLAGTGFACSTVDSDLLSLYLSNLTRSGLVSLDEGPVGR